MPRVNRSGGHCPNRRCRTLRPPNRCWYLETKLYSAVNDGRKVNISLPMQPLFIPLPPSGTEMWAIRARWRPPAERRRLASLVFHLQGGRMYLYASLSFIYEMRNNAPFRYTLTVGAQPGSV